VKGATSISTILLVDVDIEGYPLYIRINPPGKRQKLLLGVSV
jgi:hypothetical protein